MLILHDSGMCVFGQYMVEILEHTVLGGHRAVVRCDATGANFGSDVATFSFGMNSVGCALPAEPPLACSDVEAFHVQQAKPVGYQALIVYNFKGKSPNPMSGSKFAELVQIPVVMVKYECMQSLLGHYSAEHGYTVTIKASPGYYDLIKYLFPFVIIVGICFIVLLISLLIRLCRERRRLARKRLPRSQLRKIPTRKYKKGDPEETCAICLEDFKEPDKLRILPCKHAYHCKCIDPWLTKNRRVCPVCKRRVGPRNVDSSDSDTDSEVLKYEDQFLTIRTWRITRTVSSSVAEGAAGSSSSSTLVTTSRDNRPLLQHAQPIATISSSSRRPLAEQVVVASLFQQQRQPNQQSPPSTSAFSRASNLLHLSSIFHPSRCEAVGAQISSPSTTNTSSTVIPESVPSQTTASALDSQQQQPITTHFGERLRRGIAGIGSSIVDLVHRRPTSILSESNSQLIHENEDEEDSLNARRESDTLSRHTLETLDEANSNTSPDGHSMTTIHSNRNLVSVTVELPSPPPTSCSSMESSEEKT
uniref:RING-type domain-containing protein n=1 Tax=Meloidogyne hapla TaxID=6305 RepID=A0A1I8BCP0_MELHA